MIADAIDRIRTELPSETSLVAVSKYKPEEDILEAYRVGQRCFAESRPQELAAKAAALPKDIRWHFIGHLQTNKIKQVVPFAELIQSVDSERLLREIDAWCVRNGFRTRVLLELHVAAEESKQGFSPDELLEAVRNAEKSPLQCVTLCGLMGMASFTEDEKRIREDFKAIAAAFEAVSALRSDEGRSLECLGQWKERSFGMSSDWRIALDYHPTLVRIGSEIFGSR